MRPLAAWWGRLSGLVLCVLLFQEQAQAATGCTVLSVSGVNFGEYNPRDRMPFDSVGTIVYECRGAGGADTVSIELSRSRAGRFDRTMTRMGSAIEYNLFLDPARTQIWGDGTGGTGVYRGRASSQPVSVPVYGRLAPRQSLPEGNYADSIVVTLVY